MGRKYSSGTSISTNKSHVFTIHQNTYRLTTTKKLIHLFVLKHILVVQNSDTFSAQDTSLI